MDSGEDSPNKEADGTLTPSRGRKRFLFSQTVSNTLLDMENTPVKNARMFTTPRKVEKSNSLDTDDSEVNTDNETQIEKDEAEPEDSKTEEVDTEETNSKEQPAVLAPSSGEDTDDDIFGTSDAENSKLQRISIVENSTTDSDEENSEKIPRKPATPATKKTKGKPATNLARERSRNPNSVSAIAASPVTVSRAGRNNSPRIDYRTGRRLADTDRQDSTPPTAATDTDTTTKRGKVSSLAKPSKSTSKSSLVTKSREERKRTSERGSDSCSSTSSPTPKRNLNADGESVGARKTRTSNSQGEAASLPSRQTRARSSRK